MATAGIVKLTQGGSAQVGGVAMYMISIFLLALISIGLLVCLNIGMFVFLHSAAAQRRWDTIGQ